MNSQLSKQNNTEQPKISLLNDLKHASYLQINKEIIDSFSLKIESELDQSSQKAALSANEYTFTLKELETAMKIGQKWYITRSFSKQHFEYEITCLQSN